jgi:hypothetical protein
MKSLSFKPVTPPRPDDPKWGASSRPQGEAHAFKRAFQRKTVLDAGFPEEYAAKLEKNARSGQGSE